MNDPDPTDGDLHRTTRMVDEADLFALFAPRSPDPARFAAGVAARLQDGTGQVRTRRAASWLPLEVAGLFGKSPWFLLSVPALLLVGVVAAFAGALHSVHRIAANRGASRAESPTRQVWRQAAVAIVCSLGFTVAMVVGVVVAPHALGDALLLGLLASMFVLVLGLRAQARSGSMDRARVASLCLDTLWAIAMVLVPRSVFAGTLGLVSSPLTIFGALAVGIVALAPLALRSFVGAMTVAGIAFAITTVPASLFATRAKPTLATATQAVAAAELLHGEVASLPALVDLVLELRQNGQDVGLRSDMLTAMQRRLGDQPPSPFAATSLARLGAIDAATWATIAADPIVKSLLEHLVRDELPLVPNAYDEYLLHCLVATNRLDAAARDHLAGRLIEGLEQPTTLPLATAAQCVRWLDGIGRGDLVDARRERLHTMLAAHQVTSGFTRGQFCAHPTTLPVGNGDSNDHALALLHRLGPTSIDLRQLSRSLQRQSMLPPHLDGTAWVVLRSYRQALACARLGEPPAPALGELLVEERLTAAVLAFVLLCLFATWQATPRQSTVGAMP